MNKKQERIYELWLKSNNLNLHDCYKKPSQAKLDEEWRIMYACCKMKGKRFRILSYNKYTFTCAYAVEKEGKIKLYYHGPYETVIFEIPTAEKEAL